MSAWPKGWDGWIAAVALYLGAIGFAVEAVIYAAVVGGFYK